MAEREKKEKKIPSGKEASGKVSDNLPWVEKYRPDTLADVISHANIVNTLDKFIVNGRLPHLLFYGPPGTGKTSTIIACAKKINGPKYNSMVLELNASDDRGIGVVRDQIRDFASSQKLFSTGMKLIILDEADSMTPAAQAALRRVIEKYTKSTRFCLICNYLNKIIPALQSRCTQFRFGPLKKDQVQARLKEIVEKEKIVIDDGGYKAIIDLAQGDMRKCLNVLQSTHLAYPKVNEENVYLCTGKPLPSDMKIIMDKLLNLDFVKAFKEIQLIQKDKGLSLVDIVTRLHTLILTTTFPPVVLGQILDELSNIEHRLSFGTSEKLQLGALVGVFQIAKEQIAS